MSLGRPCLLLLTLCLVLTWVAPVAAVPLVTFHDLTDTVTAEGSGTAIPVVNEVIEFSLSNSPPSGLKDSFTLYIIEGGCTSGTCPVSDELQVISGSGGALPLFIFISDAAESAIANVNCSQAAGACVGETGGLQDVTAFFFDPNVPGAPTSGLIFFESDVERTVPAPATLLLLGLGLLTLRRIRHRRV